MPKIWSDRESDLGPNRRRVSDIELQRANENFALEQGLMLSNRQQRAISFR
jgi:hypothetical protein